MQVFLNVSALISTVAFLFAPRLVLLKIDGINLGKKDKANTNTVITNVAIKYELCLIMELNSKLNTLLNFFIIL